MCGIAGYFDVQGIVGPEILPIMSAAIAHRGPDAANIFVDNNCGLAHQRLSIIDLRDVANQPMTSRCGRYTIVFNGEIYNYQELAKKHALTLTTNSDTEVVLELFSKYGAKHVNELNGMFAYAIYDNIDQSLHLFRDRAGVKPLFYCQFQDTFLFASELKSLLAVDILKAKFSINQNAIASFLHLGYIPQPETIYNEVNKFPAGTYAIVSKTGAISYHHYWKLEEKFTQKREYNEVRALKTLENLLLSSVEYRLVSDVPYGVFLSGGTDSSLVAALASKVANKKVNSFTIGFQESTHNEAVYAKKIADFLGTQHHQYIVSEKESIALFDDLMNIYDEPFADTSAIPTLILSKLARQEVKMVLCGDGGDELFYGYGAYYWADRLDGKVIRSSKNLLNLGLKYLPNNRYQRIAKMFDFDHKENIQSHIFSQEQYFFSRNDLKKLLLNKNLNLPEIGIDYSKYSRVLDPMEKQAIFDFQYYLKDDLLVKVDRASMKYSLEAREPLLDYRIIEFAANLHPGLKSRNGVGKYLLKQILYNYVPKSYFDRPKWGFSIPLSKWLKGELYYLIETYLNINVLEKHQMVDVKMVQVLLSDFLKGKDHLYNRIWVLIVLHKWLEEK